MTKFDNYKQFADYWLQNVIKEQLSYTSFKSYNSKINNYVIPHIGNVELLSITRFDVQQMIHSLQQTTSLTSNSIRQVFNIFSKSLRYACEMELISKNPVIGIEPPSICKYKPTVYTQKEISKLLQVAINTDIEIPILLACKMGLRRGEISALQWKDICLKDKTLSITKTVSNANDFSKPKGKNASRVLKMSDYVLQKLLSHMDKSMLLLNNLFCDDTFVAINHNGKPLRPTYLSNSFRRLIEDNNLPKIRFHDLRHSFATNAHNKGIPIKNLSKALGHSTPVITVEYYVN